MVTSRSKSAAEAAANKRTTRSAAASGVGPKVPDISTQLEQENKKKAATKRAASSKPPVSSGSSATKSSTKSKIRGTGTYCICKGEDDGSPMIKCEGGCQNWYHFECVELDEDVAGEVERYYCPDCEAKTGLRTVSKWDFEGPDAFVKPAPNPQPAAKKARSTTPAEDIDVADSPEETDGAGSEDDYVATLSSKRTKSGKRAPRRYSVSSDEAESDGDYDESDDVRQRRVSKGVRPKRLRKVSASPAPESGSIQKRRGSSVQQPVPKRSKTVESAHDDTIRKYCLSKLEEFIRPMFEEHWEAQGSSDSEVQVKVEDTGKGEEAAASPLTTETDKDGLDQKVKTFVNELERCMMETYAEADKTGRPSAGGKYKERFRTLQFNLPKQDRVALRKGIASGRITPAQLNIMSSTELADEQTKHEIEQAEKEALQQSILQRVTAPRAKITHKGLETIEDASGQRAADAAREEEEQRMETEKREREKLARLRSLSIQQASPTTTTAQSPLSATFPKSTSPTTTTSPQQTWGAPPVAPLQGQQTAPPTSPTSSRQTIRPLFMPSMSNDMVTSEEGLSLADIINMDEDESTKDTPLSNPQQRMAAQVSAEASSSSSPVITTPSGPSPFAPSRPGGSPQRSSFDLSSLWTGQNKEEDIVNTQIDNNVASPSETTPAPGNTVEAQDDPMDVDSNDDDNERALDAILEQTAEIQPGVGDPTTRPTDIVDNLPEVWAGQVTMPKENFETLAIDVSCKQIAGRSLEPMSGYWQTLFPSPQARIDGRVPTAQSTKYLVSVRMNSSKELIVIIFNPRTDEAFSKFNELIDFLLGKDRHALVFPWGTQPKPHAPGRELYLIPLLKDHPLPEFLELMDGHGLPRERPSNILLGVFVLNKGKLIATPPSAALNAPASTITPFPPIPQQFPAAPNVPNIPPPAPAAIPSTQPTVAPTPPTKIDQATLAAEVASLTPEQISLMLQHLSQTVPLATPVGASQTTPPPQGPVSPPAPPAYPIQGMPPFPPQFPPTSQQHVQSPPGQFSPPRQYSPSGPHGQYEGRHYDDRDDRSMGHGRDDYSGRGNGWRGGDRARRGHRGRGKPFHGDRSPRPPPHDGGWGGRGRGGPPR